MAQKMSNAQLGLVGDAVGAASGAIGSVINGIFQTRENRRNREFAQQQAQQARQWQIEQWNMENEYNNPTNQMRRYIDAGLNPNLIYGDVGQGLGASAPSVPQGDAAPGTAPQVALGANLNGMLQGRLLDAQIANLDSATQQKNIENERLRERIDNDIRQQLKNLGLTDAKVDEIQSNIRLNDARVEESVQNSYHLSAMTSMLSVKKQGMILDNAFKSSTLAASIANFMDKCKVDRARAENAAQFFMWEALGAKAKAKEAFANAFRSTQEGNVAVESAKLLGLDYSVKSSPFTLNGKTASLEYWRQNASFKTSQRQLELIERYGDAEKIMELIKLGADSVEALTDAAGNVLGWIGKKRGSVVGLRR